MSVLRKFAGQTAIYGLSTIVARLINFVLTPIFVRQFPAAIYGIFTQLYSWAAMGSAVLAFGMETTFFRYLEKYADDRQKVLNNTFSVTFLLSLLFVATVFLFSPSIATWLNDGAFSADYNRYVRFFAIILAADAIAIIPFALLRAEGRAIRFGLLKLINVVALVSINLLFLFGIPMLLAAAPATATYFGWFREGWLGYVFIANMVAALFTLLLLLPEIGRLRLRMDRKLLLDMLTYSFPVLISNISFIINEHLDKIAIPLLIPGEAGKEANGIYGAVSRIAVFLSISVQAFRLGAEPFFFSYAKNENAKRVYALIMDYFVIAMVMVMVGISVNIEWLKYFIKGENVEQQAIYWSGLHIVPLLLLGYVLLGVYMNLSVWYKLIDRTRFGLYISGVGALVTIALNLLLIPRYGYLGAVWVTVLVYVVMVSLSYFLGQRHYPIPYRVGKNIGYIAAGAGLCWLAFAVFDRHLIIGNLLFVVFAGAAFLLERKTLLAIWQKEKRGRP